LSWIKDGSWIEDKLDETESKLSSNEVALNDIEKKKDEVER